MRFNVISKSRIDAADAEFVLTDDERDVLALSRRGKSVVAISLALGMGKEPSSATGPALRESLTTCSPRKGAFFIFASAKSPEYWG